MLVQPDITLTQAVGGSIRFYCMRYGNAQELALASLASGLILGEGAFSLVNLFLGSAGVPHLQNILWTGLR